ncbi:MAG: alanine racemase [Bacteroidales bacterium]|nr:alanine racemase [Bacteroidales bacterium]
MSGNFDIKKIVKPTLLIDEQKCRRNILFMHNKSKSSDVSFRPHFKTHQSAEIGNWFREAGVGMITVSSVTMCRYFMDNGWDDITIAFPANPRESDEINKIAGKINLNVLVADYEQLQSFADRLTNSIGVFIKIDTGYRRSGIDWNHYADIVRIYEYVKELPALRMKGFLSHSGHTYSVKGRERVLEIFNDTRQKLLHTRETTPTDGMIISIGDTPSCSIATDFAGVDEIRPGNFVFYDLMQTVIGSCTENEIAVALAAPVVSINRHRSELIIYGGAVHLSKECIHDGDKTIYGKVCLLSDEGWDVESGVGFITSLSQEHGVVKVSDLSNLKVKPGDIIAVLPVHSCLTANLMREYVDREGKFISRL